MNIFILTDLEGIAGVSDIEYMQKGTEKYELACTYLADNLNLAVKTCFECGAENVYYLDGHSGGGNISEKAVDPRAVRCSINSWQNLLNDGKIDCQIELGSHGRAGTMGGFLDHTITSACWFCHRINGREMSELSLHALLCASYGVPVVACIGDEAACSQAREYIPDIYTGAVKKAVCRNRAVLYDNADKIICDTIKDALTNFRSVSLFKMEAPYTVELTFYRSDMCDEAYERCAGSAERIDARTLIKTLPSIASYDDLKF